MKRYRVGIVGCGGIAKQKHFPALSRIDDVDMVAFCDIIPERAAAAAAEYGVAGATCYASYEDMLAKEQLDIVHVLTPNRSHCEITVAALEAGCHVMCEKPMAVTTADAKAMLDATKRTGKKLTIGYQNRFKPESLYLKRACGNGDLGEIYYAQARNVRRRGVPTWGVFLDAEAQGGGPLIDIGTHALDLTLWLMDNHKVKSVIGTTYRKLADQVPESGNGFGDWDPKEFTVEDSAFGFITMQNGATIQLETSWALNTLLCTPLGPRTQLCGTKGGADMEDGLRINFVEYGKLTTKCPALAGDGVDFFDARNSLQAHELEAERWLEAIRTDTEPVTKPEQALAVTQILEAIYESAQTGKAIYFDEQEA